MTEDELVGWHHRLNGHEFEQAPGDGEEQGSLACCSPWGLKELDTIEQLNNNLALLPKVSPRISVVPGSSPGIGRVGGGFRSDRNPHS